MKAFEGDNPSVMYIEATRYLRDVGDTCFPRGKEIKETRPVAFEFTNPLNRVTFLRGRRINPFFQLAESLWILAGHSDLAFLEPFNANMKQFSDDGVSFNASYGERMRYFSKNDLNRFIVNPVDQLYDCYLKLKADPDTRQAIIVLSNPMFDNYRYTSSGGRDVACNMTIMFKQRDGKLNMTVTNRSNDIHWGLFGANLCQFSTIQEVLAAWLGIRVGTYTHFTDSCHYYLDSYGSNITEELMSANPGGSSFPLLKYATEPRMSLDVEGTDRMLRAVFDQLAPLILNDDIIKTECAQLVSLVVDNHKLLSNYWYMVIIAMIAYRLVKTKNLYDALLLINENLPASQWVVSMLYFLKNQVKKSTGNEKHLYKEMVAWLSQVVDEDGTQFVQSYLSLEEI